MRTVSCFVLAAVLVATAGYTTLPAQQPGKKIGDAKAIDVFRQFRSLMAEGRYDVAAVVLQTFMDTLAADPNSDAVLLDLENRYGTTVFQNLRTVPKWSDDPKLDKQARDNVDALVTRSKAATDKILRTPERVNKYVANLGATPEERIFAENELRKTGNYAVPFMVKAFQDDTNRRVSTGLLLAIPNLESHTMGGWLAALDGFKPEQQHIVLTKIVERRNSPDLLTTVQTDFVPHLWRVLARTRDEKPESPARVFARSVLTTLGQQPDKVDPRDALVAIARTFHDRKAKFGQAKANPNGSPNTVPVWVWDGKTLREPIEVPISQAEEYYGLKYARWVLEVDPKFVPAQRLVLALASERAVERGNFGDLSKTDPAAYQLLASAPVEVLHDLLEEALAQKRTGLVMALVQALGDRADKTAAGPRPAPPGVAPQQARPALLVRALEYPDPRVQLAAANALLRSPIPVDPAVRSKVVDILRRAAAADPGVPGTARGQVLIADPNRQRAGATAAILRGLGYDTELFTTGRDLLRRVARSSDFDMVIVDHHIVFPELVDVVAHLRADLRMGNRPVLVVASADQPRLPSVDALLLRTALLIAATESDPTRVPPPFNPDPASEWNIKTKEVIPGMGPEQLANARKQSGANRDNAFSTIVAARKARLMRVVETTGIPLTEAQQFVLELKAERVTLGVLAAEFPISPESAPATADRIVRLSKQLAAQAPVTEYAGVGLIDLGARIERLELDVAKVDPAQKRYDDLRARVDVEGLGLTIRSTRDPVAEAKVTHLVRGFPGVKVIPEPYTKVGFEDDVRAAFTDDPAAAPRAPAEKKAGAKLAIEWLRKMATGELPGFPITTNTDVEKVLRDAVLSDDNAEPAIDALSRFSTKEAQQDLVNVALNAARPLPVRLRAADAVIRHMQSHGKSIAPATLADIDMRVNTEPNPELRGKLLVIKGLASGDTAEYMNNLLRYNPPLVRPAPKEPVPAKPMDPKEQDPEKKEPAKP